MDIEKFAEKVKEALGKHAAAIEELKKEVVALKVSLEKLTKDEESEYELD